MVGVVKDRDLSATGVLAGKLDGVFYGLGARVEERRLLGEVARGVLVEKLADLYIRGVRGHREERVGELCDLLLNGGNHAVVGVTDRHNADAGAQVDELVAVDVNENRTVCVVDVNGECGTHASRNFF